MSKHRSIDKTSRLYLVTFNEYTNCLNDTVSDNNKEISKTQYIECSKGGSLIIRESEFEFYQKFGGGIKSMTYLGFMYEE